MSRFELFAIFCSSAVAAGLAAAKKLGRKGDRKRKMTDSKLSAAKKLLESGVLPKDVANNLGVSLATLYRWIPASDN
jgi:DNA invertase Pin-like site-specific DNA recombinase